jgi:hypothetical protein
MAITVEDAAGATRRILSEHKITAVDTPAQRARYTTVSAESRMLAEFVNYLERKDVGVAILEPMTSRDVFTYRHARESLIKSKTLLEQAVRQLDRAALIEERGSRDPFRSWFAKVPAPNWPLDVETWITGELLVSAQDNWVRDPLDEPAFAAGYTVPISRGRWPAPLAEATAVRRALEANADITVTDSHEHNRGRIVCTLYLSEVAAHGRDLAEQAQYVAQWAHNSLQKIADVVANPADGDPIDAAR